MCACSLCLSCCLYSTATDTHSKETTNLPSLLAFPAPVSSGDRPAAAASKLKVGPGLLETAYKTGMKRVFGSHWIVAAGAYVGERALAGAPGTGCVSRRHARLKAAAAQWRNS